MGTFRGRKACLVLHFTSLCRVAVVGNTALCLNQNLRWQVCIQISWLLGRNHKSNRKAEIPHTRKNWWSLRIERLILRRKLDCVNASFCPPPRLVLRGMFLLSHFCRSAKVSKMLLITKTVPDGGKSNYKKGKKPQHNKMGEWEKRYMFFSPGCQFITSLTL